MNVNHFLALGIDDQNQYFGKTYFQITNPETKEKKWIWCIGFLNRNLAKINVDPAHMGDTQTIDLKKNLPDLSFPRTGLYNLKNSTVFLQKIPARQSKKGLCKETGKITAFSDHFRDPLGRYLIPIKVPEVWKMSNIQEMFEYNHDFSLEDAMIFLKKKSNISFAIDIEFGLSLGIYTKYLSLWYKQILVGEVPSPREILLQPDCLFKQEVLDRFLPEGIQIGEKRN